VVGGGGGAGWSEEGFNTLLDGLMADIFTVFPGDIIGLGPKVGSDPKKPVLRIRIRIHVFLGLQDPDPLIRGMDPDPALDPDPDPSIIKQK
jgi:hypothetical protein